MTALKIALVGYGKMGKAVEQEALLRGHEIVLRADKDNMDAALALRPQQCDCFIEFSHPEAAVANFKALFATGVPVVTGTTGWLAQLDEVKQALEATNGAFLHSSNFSPGVNMLFKLNQRLAAMMNRYPDFDVMVEEAHHRHKKDAPSGTALSLAHQILEGLERKDAIAHADLQHRPPKPEELSVAYTRAGEIIGKHKVSYVNDIECLSISHEAYNRRGFALGAVLAAEWLVGKKGSHEFIDIFEG